MAKYNFDDVRHLFPTNLSGIKFFEITVSFVHNEKSEITNYMVISQDVTERVLWQNKYDNLYEEAVRSKKELLESEQRMIQLIRQNELVLNNINSGLAYIANDYIVQWENISLCSKSLSYEAYKKGELCYLTAHNRTTPCENCVMQRARRSGQVESILFNLDNKHVIEVFATPIFNEQGDVDGVVIRVDDVTERQHMIGELEKARSRAEQSDKLKSAFLANMSHEIRTPLNSILGFSQILGDRYQDDPDTKVYASIIVENSNNLLRLITDVLELSDLDKTGKMPADIMTNINDCCKLSVDNIRKDVQEGVELHFQPAREEFIVKSNPERIMQVLVNLLHNAAKFTPSGDITLAYNIMKEGQRICFTITDTGPGIPLEKQEAVFSRFAKLDSYSQGTGLGLSICRGIADKLGGSLTLDSKYTKGGRFVFIIPYS